MTRSLRSWCLLVLAACVTPEVSSTATPGSAPTAGVTAPGEAGAGRVEAVSLLGRPLVSPPIPADRRAGLEADLAAAERALAAAPADEDALVWYGRRLAYLGRFEEAQHAFTRGLAVHPDSHRLLRHRGHRSITRRQLDAAVADLTRAASLIRGVPDTLEPDGQPNAAGIPRSTTHSNVWYHLGLAHYLKGDLRAARDAYERALEYSFVNDDMLVATTHWLYMTLRRLGEHEAAQALLAPISADMDVLENDAYLQCLLLDRGERTPEQVLSWAAAQQDPIADATVGYGVASWHFVEGRRDLARRMFEAIVAGPAWPAFGYVAAESELARGTAR